MGTDAEAKRWFGMVPETEGVVNVIAAGGGGVRGGRARDARPARSARLAGFQIKQHVPEAIRLATLHELERG